MSSIEIKTVTMKDGSQRLKLLTPYHPDLPARLRKLGGEWNDTTKAWYFATDLSAQLRQVCVDFFAIDPLADTPPDLVDVRIDAYPLYESGDTYWALGRALLRRPGRDNDVKPGDGVSIISGGFSSSGGSRNNPKIGYADEGTVLLVRGVPRSAALAFQAEQADYTITLVEQAPPPTLLLAQAKAAAGSLASLLKKLDVEQRHTVISELIASLEGVE